MCFQLGGNSLGKVLSCFSTTIPLCAKRGPYRNGLSRSVCLYLTGLNPIEQLWDEFESWLLTRANRPTSVPDLTNALVTEWNQVSAAIFEHLVESLPRRVQVVIVAKGDQLHIIAYDFGMRWSTSKCPHTFGYVVYVVLLWRTMHNPLCCVFKWRRNLMVFLQLGMCLYNFSFHISFDMNIDSIGWTSFPKVPLIPKKMWNHANQWKNDLICSYYFVWCSDWQL
jgi:hypothetical protein